MDVDEAVLEEYFSLQDEDVWGPWKKGRTICAEMNKFLLPRRKENER